MSEGDLVELERRFLIRKNKIGPESLLPDFRQWLKLSVRFITKDHAIRDIKDRMRRYILIGEFEKAGIEIASATIEIVGLPPIHATSNPSPHDLRRHGSSYASR